MTDELEFVHILHITHKHGENFYAHRTKEGAELAIAEYVNDNWDEEMPKGTPIPDNPTDSVAAYFEHMGAQGGDSESYSINISAVLT